jgi:hypothetical protein
MAEEYIELFHMEENDLGWMLKIGGPFQKAAENILCLAEGH